MNYDIQEVFDLLIDHEIYNPHCPNLTTSWGFMCDALENAEERELIPTEVAESVKEEIEKYIEGSVNLGWMLYINGLPNEPDDLLAIYQDWENRPELSYD